MSFERSFVERRMKRRDQRAGFRRRSILVRGRSVGAGRWASKGEVLKKWDLATPVGTAKVRFKKRISE